MPLAAPRDMSSAVAPYLITDGGALRRFERAAHVTHGGKGDWMRRAVAIVGIVYLPLIVIGVGMRLATGEWIPAIVQISSHVRALIVIPLLLAAEPVMDARAKGFGTYLLEAEVVRTDEDAYRKLVTRAEQRRNSLSADAILFTLALGTTLSTATLVNASVFIVIGTMPGIVALRFLIFRWLWRWALWGVFLWRLSRLRLDLRGTHADQLAGLGPVLGPAHVFGFVVLGCSAMISAVWTDLALHGELNSAAVVPVAATVAVVAVVLALAPSSVFIAVLYRARKTALERHGALTQRYVKAFDTRWTNAPGTDALGTADIQSLADIGNSFEMITRMRVLPWSPRVVQTMVLATLVPMLPLAMLEVGAVELLTRIGKALL